MSVEQLGAPNPGLWEAAVNWLNDIWTWSERLTRQGGPTGQTVWLVFLVLAVVVLGSWVQSRIARS